MNYLKASDILPVSVVDVVQQYIEQKIPDFSGASIYFPARGSVDVRNRSTKERAYAKALAVIAMHDGFTQEEAATMAGTTRQTVIRWKETYGTRILDELSKLRSEGGTTDD